MSYSVHYNNFIAVIIISEKTVIMKVFCPDYLRVLESGNFMSFVAMVHDPSLKIAIIKTDVVRLKVYIQKAPRAPFVIIIKPCRRLPPLDTRDSFNFA